MALFVSGIPMALTATIRKAELQISDMDRGYYASHTLTLAQHPSETDERLMVRLLAFALNAEDRLEFGRGLSGRAADIWWERNASALNKLKSLEVMDLPADFVEQWGAKIERSMRWTVLIQDGEVQLISDSGELSVIPTWRKPKPQA